MVEVGDVSWKRSGAMRISRRWTAADDRNADNQAPRVPTRAIVAGGPRKIGSIGERRPVP
jgi:hypothetical protein